MDEDKISKMELCVVNVEDDYYYYDQPAYQYGRDKHTWYSMECHKFCRLCGMGKSIKIISG